MPWHSHLLTTDRAKTFSVCTLPCLTIWGALGLLPPHFAFSLGNPALHHSPAPRTVFAFLWLPLLGLCSVLSQCVRLKQP